MTDKKIALITGANKGIGKEIARQLGRLGIMVIIGARDEKKGKEAEKELRSQGIDVLTVKLDVTEQSTIDAAALEIEKKFGKLDILVNNAGIGIDTGKPSTIDMDTLYRTYNTNVFGPFRMIKAFLPLLQKSEAGRIVNMSSGLGSLERNSSKYWETSGTKLLAYNSSKSALNALTLQFAYELRKTAIKVNSAAPGFVATDINQHRGTRTVEQGARAPVRLATLPEDGPTGGFFEEAGPVPW
ncbi:MAG: SDR family oxidoreductase [Thermodesulfobacteriota bacterium]|jgi:NAD(P)-dependent dehydrogenase (short-subunit alcohol dehydrogenase family)